MVRTKYLVVYFSLMVSLLIFVGAMSDGSVSNFVSGNVPVNVPIASVPISVPHCDVPVLLVKDILNGFDHEGSNIFYSKVNSFSSNQELWSYDLGLDGIGGTKDDGGERLVRKDIRLDPRGTLGLFVSLSNSPSGEPEAVYTINYPNRQVTDLILI